MTRRIFGEANGHRVEEITLRNQAGAVAKILTYGAVVRDLMMPKPDGTMQRVVLGLETLEDYITHSPHFGAIAGRYANRIAGGRFVLDGVMHQLPLNQEGRHSLHGGGQGFGKDFWQLLHHDVQSVTLALHSPAGAYGYPGTMTTMCRYTLTDANTLRVELFAHSDAPTILNLCHHSYFNLDGGADILDHTLQVEADFITSVVADLIPDGQVEKVAATLFDFTTPRPIRLQNPDGTRHWYDHNFVLNHAMQEQDGASGMALSRAARLASPKSGLAMEVWTTEPCCQVYDGFKLNLAVKGLDGTTYGTCAGICLEPQHAPNSPNLPHFPSTVLRPGALYRQVTEYRFGA
jgi:aldose 1-epimerase